jgi:subtilase family serine protease
MPGHESPFRRWTAPSKSSAPPSSGVPDVSADADPTLGPAIAVTGGGQRYLVHPAGGTAAAAAIWAGLIALADQDAGHALGLINPVIYRIGRGSTPSTSERRRSPVTRLRRAGIR